MKLCIADPPYLGVSALWYGDPEGVPDQVRAVWLCVRRHEGVVPQQAALALRMLEAS